MDPKTQVEAARRAVLAVPRGDLATIEVSGADRLSWLNGLLTCDLVKRLPAGEAAYGLAVARSGRVIADATVLVGVAGLAGEDAGAGGTLLVAVSSRVAQELRAHLEHYLVMEDAEMAAGFDGFEAWALHGPRAREVLDAAVQAGAHGATMDVTGLGGAFLLAPVERAPRVREAIATAASGAGGVLGDEAGWEALRLERAVPRFGVDFDDKTYPQEAGLERTAVAFDKGCYLGQEVVCMLELRGHVKRKLAPLVLQGAAAPAAGAPVTDEAGAAIGEVTSSALSPTLGKPVALAMVKRAFTSAGKAVVVAGDPAVVVERPA